jgi:hypothetical protein
MDPAVAALRYPLFVLALILPAVPVIAQGVGFRVSSVSTIVASQDISEPLGLISLTATTAGTLKAGSTFSISYGVATLLPSPAATVACSQLSCNAALALASAGNVATVTVMNDVALSVGDLVCVFDFLFNAQRVGLGTVTATVSAASSAPASNPITLLGSSQVQVVSVVPWTPIAEIASTSLAFGNIAVGSSSPPRPTFVINAGTASLNISSIVASPNVFTQTNDCPSSLSAGQQCTITVTFTPTVVGAIAAGFVTVTDNATGSPQIVTLTGIGVTAAANSTNVGSMAQIASGAGWGTVFTVVNTGTTPADVQMAFFNDSGSALSLPITFPQSPLTPAQQASTVNQTLAAGATLLIQSQGLASQALQVGSAQLSTSGSVGGFAIFHYSPTGQEAIVPLETRNAKAYVLAFDNTNGLATGVALANESNQTANVAVILLDDTGAPIGTGTISLAAAGHTSFMLTQNYAATAGRRGTVEFDAPPGGRISALGIRANGNALTTVPVVTK